MLRDSPCELACQQQQLENKAIADTGEVVILSESVKDGTMCGDRCTENLCFFLYINCMVRVCEHPSETKGFLQFSLLRGDLKLCLSGRCERVGCDLRMRSAKVLDQCGVCGGDIFSC